MTYVTYDMLNVSQSTLDAVCEFIESTASTPKRSRGVMAVNYTTDNPYSAQQLLLQRKLDGFTLSYDNNGDIRGFAGFYTIEKFGVVVGGVRLLNSLSNEFDPPALLSAQRNYVQAPMVMTINTANVRLWAVIRWLSLQRNVAVGSTRQLACDFYASCHFYDHPIMFNAVEQYVFSTEKINIDMLDGFCRC